MTSVDRPRYWICRSYHRSPLPSEAFTSKHRQSTGGEPGSPSFFIVMERVSCTLAEVIKKCRFQRRRMKSIGVNKYGKKRTKCKARSSWDMSSIIVSISWGRLPRLWDIYIPIRKYLSSSLISIVFAETYHKYSLLHLTRFFSILYNTNSILHPSSWFEASKHGRRRKWNHQTLWLWYM